MGIVGSLSGSRKAVTPVPAGTPPERSTVASHSVVPSPLVVEFAGERHDVPVDREFTIGRGGDLVIDDNLYLHRRFLVLSAKEGLWWLSNVGSRIAATVTDSGGRLHARLAPGARLPVVFDRLHVLFGAGATSYDLTLHSAVRFLVDPAPRVDAIDDATMGSVPLSPSQRLLVVALAENVLRRNEPGEIPSSADAASRLGWTLTAFTRKLDTICGKLEREGVTGLRGGRGKLATNRRMRLVEHAVATRLVTREDLILLDGFSAG
jgi:hypothetical protein